MINELFTGILDDYLLEVHPYLKNQYEVKNPSFFMQDGATCYWNINPMQWFEVKKIKILSPWPARSPDINKIENVWRHIKRELWLRWDRIINKEIIGEK